MLKELILIVLMILASQSCSTVQTKIDSNKNYKLDIWISNKASGPQYEAEGMIVLPRKSLYTIYFEADAKINYISFRTCSREIVQTDPSVGINRKKYMINYSPNEIESSGDCPTMVSAFNKDGMMSVGFISYEDPRFTLPAINICGENTSETKGSSVCQSRVSSIEKIKFDVEVMTDPDSECEIESGNRGKEFTYKIKKGFCPYIFIETKGAQRMHKLDVYGYEDVQLRL